MDFHPYPLLFKPVYKQYAWGGSRVASKYGRDVPGGVCAESWEIADRDEGMSVVRNGPLQCTALGQLAANVPEQLVGAGARACRSKRFPLLVKIIDAASRLSVQVHPGEQAAALHGGEAKTEAWYVLDAEPGAFVFAGLKPSAGRSEFVAALKRGELENILVRIPAERGGVIYVPAGLVHAVGEGCLLLEIQQNSNTTYRVYDWGRTDFAGRPRPLHISQAMNAIEWSASAAYEGVAELGRWGRNSLWRLLQCPYFELMRLELAGPQAMAKPRSTFHACFVSEGALALEAGGLREELRAGDSCLVPAALPKYALWPASERAELIIAARGGKLAQRS